MKALDTVVQHHVPGDDESYDTLDNILLAPSTVEELYQRLEYGLKGTVGICMGGENEYITDGHWGVAISLPTGERLQMRLLPKNSFGVPLGPYDYRLIATRRTSNDAVPVVGCAIVFLPRDAFGDSEPIPLSCGRSVGCRGIHVVLPSLFNKHDSHRDNKSWASQLDIDGFHSVRPSSVLMPQTQKGRTSNGSDFAITAGDSYLVIAGHMAGIDVPDHRRRCSEITSIRDYSRTILSKQRKLNQSIGEQETDAYTYSALTLCELMSAEGCVSIMSTEFFHGALPFKAFSPLGIPLSLCLAVHVACYPERFGVQQCNECDAFSNREIMFSFHSRWKRVLLNEFRAIDVAINSGFDRAIAEIEGNSALKIHFQDTMVLWQRIGQRLISKVMSDPRDEVNDHRTRDVYCTTFGTSDLVKNAVCDAKYDSLAKKGLCRPIIEAPVDTFFLAARCEQRTTLYNILDSGEEWLRTGMFGEIRMNKENVNVPLASTSRENRMHAASVLNIDLCANSNDEQSVTTDTSSSEESDDVDDLMDNKLNVSALETATEALAISMIHGPFSQHGLGIKSFLLGPGAKNKCADCDEDVHALQGLLFGRKGDHCQRCNRRRCFKCAKEALEVSKSATSFCLRCDPAAPRLRARLAEPSRSPAKKSSKKK